MGRYLLEARHDTRKSFYGKAFVLEEDRKKTLFSYETEILELTLYSYETEILELGDTENIKLLCEENCLSNTTMRHLREFLKQEGFEKIASMSKSEILQAIQ